MLKGFDIVLSVSHEDVGARLLIDGLLPAQVLEVLAVTVITSWCLFPKNGIATTFLDLGRDHASPRHPGHLYHLRDLDQSLAPFPAAPRLFAILQKEHLRSAFDPRICLLVLLFHHIRNHLCHQSRFLCLVHRMVQRVALYHCHLMALGLLGHLRLR